ncbi:RagB/SusD family nutrient uptake outer membrane protein [Mucilaginibacter limnophilus]|nr:RagB/SusD family nutrient uptake outer membrane protein [Mucilaginibacter limnophilus]
MKTITKSTIHAAMVCTGIVLLFSIISCKKYLEEKPDLSIATPSTMSDIEGILNNYNFMNARYPSASEVSADNFYLLTADFNALNDRQRNFYLRQKFDDIGGDYSALYTTIEYANIILETLEKISGDETQKAQYRAEARFVRASCHYALAQLFAAPYNNNDSALGIALRLTANINERPTRATVNETYQAILDDLQAAAKALPSSLALRFRPNRAAAFGLLSRVFLTMQNFEQAEKYADSCLSISGTLLDYNNLNANATVPIAQFNEEILYDARSSPPAALATSRAKIDTLLYASYQSNDLRQTVYFRTNTNGSRSFKGNYTGLNNASIFSGVATDEVYLNGAEAAVRNGHQAKALSLINALMAKRWKTGTFQPYQTTDAATLLTEILKERRKELLFRSLRWADLRRLNQEAGRSQVLTREINGQTYTLEPQSPRYVFAIDRAAVEISGLPQNP